MAYNPETMSFELPNTDMIYISGLPSGISEEDLSSHFGQIGVIKFDKKQKKNKIWIYKDKQTGAPKGDATVSYEDPFTAASAVEWFNGKEWKGAQHDCGLPAVFVPVGVCACVRWFECWNLQVQPWQ
jgi:RNA recognition motif-containing protein